MFTKFLVVFASISLFCVAFGKPILTSTYVIKNGEMTKVEQEVDNIEIEEPLLNLDSKSIFFIITFNDFIWVFVQYNIFRYSSENGTIQ